MKKIIDVFKNFTEILLEKTILVLSIIIGIIILFLPIIVYIAFVYLNVINDTLFALIITLVVSAIWGLSVFEMFETKL